MSHCRPTNVQELSFSHSDSTSHVVTGPQQDGPQKRIYLAVQVHLYTLREVGVFVKLFCSIISMIATFFMER